MASKAASSTVFYIVTGEPFKQSAELTGEPIKMKGSMEHWSSFWQARVRAVTREAQHRDPPQLFVVKGLVQNTNT